MEVLDEESDDDEDDIFLLLEELEKVGYMSPESKKYHCRSVCNSDDILEPFKVSSIEDEEVLADALGRLFRNLNCHRITRPYSQHYVTTRLGDGILIKRHYFEFFCFRGSNRVTKDNFDQKFPSQICKSLFRFEKPDIFRLVTILQVFCILGVHLIFRPDSKCFF